MSSSSLPAAKTKAATATATAITTNEGSEDSQNEEELRNQLRQALERIKKREPIDPSYKSLLMSGAVTSRRPVIPKDKFYKPIGSRLRERVEKFMTLTQGKDPFDRILQRQPLEQPAMRAAFTLREAKEHEQTKMLAATMASLPRRNGMDDPTRKRHLEAIAMGLQSRGGKKKKTTSPSTLLSTSSSTATEQTELARQRAELERQRAAAREREEARRRREEQERRRREEELVRQRNNRVESPQQAIQKIIQPAFQFLWDMEFDTLGGSNPFRIVIDRDNYIAMGVPDYFDVIETPMNLTYMQEKINNMQYENIQSFFQDVELMLNNALKYNNDTNNPYHIAANEMKRKFLKIRKKVVSTLQQKQQAQNR